MRARISFGGVDFPSATGVLETDGSGPEAVEKRWLLLREADDRELVRRAREGRVEAFNALVTRWEKRIYNYLLRLSPDAEEAFDLAQETFLKAYQNLGRLDDAARFGPWLYRIAHNEAISLMRRRRPEGQAPENAPELECATCQSRCARQPSIVTRRSLHRPSCRHP